LPAKAAGAGWKPCVTTAGTAELPRGTETPGPPARLLNAGDSLENGQMASFIGKVIWNYVTISHWKPNCAFNRSTWPLANPVQPLR
jgi:hypothetical protein